MRKSFSFVAIALTMVLCSYAMAKDATAAKPLHGKVTAVAADGTSITISSHPKVKGDAPVETTVKIDASTKITKEGETVKAADLKDASVVVTLNDDKTTAVTIEVHAAKKKPAAAK